MSVQLRLPNISGNDREMLSQIRSYLYQIIPELEFAINNVSGTSTTVVESPTPLSLIPANTLSNASAQATFNSIKALIIKSAEIVEAYYQEINRKLEGTYVAQSDFGQYAEQTRQEIEETSTSTTQLFENVQTIKGLIYDSIQGVRDRVIGVDASLEDAKIQFGSSLDDVRAYVSNVEETVINTSAYLRTGVLYTTEGGIPVYGVEIGQSVKDENGEDGFKKFARFISEKLSFYDSNGYEVAYISDKKLFIKTAEITVAFQIGKLMDTVMANGDVVTKWVGG